MLYIIIIIYWLYFFDATNFFKGYGRNVQNNFVGFLKDLKTSKFPFEII